MVLIIADTAAGKPGQQATLPTFIS